MKSSQRNDWRFYFSCDTDICWKMYLRNIVRVCIGIGEIPLVGRLGILLDRWSFCSQQFYCTYTFKTIFQIHSIYIYIYIYIVWKKKNPSQNCLICNLVWKKTSLNHDGYPSVKIGKIICAILRKCHPNKLHFPAHK